MSDDISKVNIMMFKKTPCEPCTKVEPILKQIIKSSRDSASLTLIDSDKEKDDSFFVIASELPLLLVTNVAISEIATPRP